MQLRLVLLALAFAGCLSYGGGDVGSGIFGVAMMGPTCPVERDPPDPACADRPYQGDLRATRRDGGVAGVFATDARGEFNVSLPAGEYVIRHAGEPGTPPTCSAVEPVIVSEGRWTRVDVACDTGIR